MKIKGRLLFFLVIGLSILWLALVNYAGLIYFDRMNQTIMTGIEREKWIGNNERSNKNVEMDVDVSIGHSGDATNVMGSVGDIIDGSQDVLYEDIVEDDLKDIFDDNELNTTVAIEDDINSNHAITISSSDNNISSHALWRIPKSTLMLSREKIISNLDTYGCDQLDVLFVGPRYSGHDKIAHFIKDHLASHDILIDGTSKKASKIIRVGYCTKCYYNSKLFAALSMHCGRGFPVVIVLRDPVSRAAHMLQVREILKSKSLNKVSVTELTRFEAAEFMNHTKNTYNHTVIFGEWQSQEKLSNARIVFYEDYLRFPIETAEAILKMIKMKVSAVHHNKDIDLLNNESGLLNLYRYHDTHLKFHLVARRYCGGLLIGKMEVFFQSTEMTSFFYDMSTDIQNIRGNRNTILPLDWTMIDLNSCKQYGPCQERYLQHLHENTFDPYRECQQGIGKSLKKIIAIVLTPPKPQKFGLRDVKEQDKIKKLTSLATSTCDAVKRIKFYSSAKVIVYLAENVDGILHILLKSNHNCQDASVETIKFPFNPDQVSMDFKEINDNSHNCCGWYEYAKLSLWSKVEYDAILYLDIDAVHGIAGNLDHLFDCAKKVDFLYASGPYASLNAGVLLLRPNMKTFKEMSEDIVKFRFTKWSGWWNTGGGVQFGSVWGLLLNQHRSEHARGAPMLSQQSLKKDSISAALSLFVPSDEASTTPLLYRTRTFRGIEGPQGYLYYWFVLRRNIKKEFKAIGEAVRLRGRDDVEDIMNEDSDKSNDHYPIVKKLEPCIYNYQGDCLYCREHFWKNESELFRMPLISHKGFYLKKNESGLGILPSYFTNCYNSFVFSAHES